MESWNCFDLKGCLHFLLDLGLLGYVTLALATFWLRQETRLEYASVKFLVIASSVMVIVTQLAGYTGSFNKHSFTVILALFVAASARLRSRIPPMLSLWHSIWMQLSRAARVIAGAILAIMLLLAVTNASSFPMEVDTLSYRVPRIGMWLQEGFIGHFLTGDERMNYTPHNAALMMSWIVAHFDQGFPGMGLTQNLGGALCIGAIAAFGRRLGLGLTAKTFGVLVFLLMPSSIAEMLNGETNLLATSFCIAYLLLLDEDLSARQITPLPWMALALALGTKATVIYWLPGLGLITLYWLWQHKWFTDPPRIARLTGLACLAFLLFGSGRYIQNTLAYGNPIAPLEAISRHGTGTVAQNTLTPGLNLLGYAVTEIVPSNNPAGLRTLFLKARTPVLQTTRDDAAGMYRDQSRRSVYAILFAVGPGGSIIGRGVIPYLLVFAGLTVAWRQGMDRRFLLGFFGLIVAWWICISGTQAWIEENTRYFVLTNPLLAILSMPLLAIQNKILKNVLLLVVTWLAASNLLVISLAGFKVGLSNFTERHTYSVWLTHQFQRNECQRHFQGKTVNVLVVNSLYSVTSGYFRNPFPTRVFFARPEDLPEKKDVLRVKQELQCDLAHVL
ncbi:MAG TPA: hypothetical protein VGH19_23160 [Verrucomicrobiae bacterium]